MATTEAQTESHDLLPRLIPFLDRHLVFPILEFLEKQESSDASTIKALKFELLKETNMSDYVGSLEADIKGLSEAPASYTQKREAVLAKRQSLEDASSKMTALLDNQEVTNTLRSDKVANMNYLRDEHGVTPEDVSALYDFGQFLFSVGDYEAASDLLFQFRLLSTDNEKTSAATWGKLACEVLQANWEQAMDEISKVREGIDTRLFNAPLAQLSHRTWLLHW